MSLNGLDDLKIREAYDTVLTKASGWFLLKYASRDEIELSECGSGGIVEMRNTLINYDEPLFGFLRYRDKNVIIKYVPTECSRLVQARVTVHLGAVTDKFSSNHAILSIGSSRELRDTNLSAACSLQSISGSRSSSASSLNRRPLLEIAEEEEEEGNLETELSKITERPSSIVNPAISESSTSQSGGSYGLSPSRKNSDAKTSSSIHRRNTKSSQNENFIHSPHNSSGRQKVKLCPRPSTDVVGRCSPQATSAYRPVSTLPAGLKPFAKTCRSEKDHPRLRYTSESPIRAASPSLSTAPQDYHTSLGQIGDRPLTSSGFSIRSLPSPASSANSKAQAKESAKARLLRAQEMRKKKIEATEPSKLVTTPIKIIPLPEMTPPISPNSFADIQPALSMLSDETSFDESLFMPGVNSTPKADDSDGTRSESCSMFAAATSEGAESTKASSISESMEELIQEFSTVAPAIIDNSMMSPALTEPEVIEKLGVRSDTSDLCNPLDEQETELPVLSPTVYHPAKKISAEVTSHDKTYDLNESTDEIVSDPKEPGPSHTVCSSVEEATLSFTLTPPECNIPIPRQEVVESESAPFDSISGQTAHSPNQKETTRCDVPRSKFSLPRSKFSVPYALENSRQNDVPSQRKEDSLPIHDRRPGNLDIRPCESQIEDVDRTESSHSETRTGLQVTPRSIAESDANFSSDDEFMEELQSAVFQSAQPISMAKTPNSTSSPIGKNFSEPSLIKRSSLTPLSKDEPANLRSLTYPRLENSRSTELLTRAPSQPTTLMPRKSNLGSSITQRIKALEKLSVQESELNSTPSTIAIVPTFYPVRKINSAATSNGNSSLQTNQNRANPHTQPEKLAPSQTSSDSASTFPNNTQDTFHQNQLTSNRGSEDFTPYDALKNMSENDQSKKPTAEIRSKLSFSTLDEQPNLCLESTKKERRSSFAVIIDLFTDRQRSPVIESRRSVSLENSCPTSPKSLQSFTVTPHATGENKRDYVFTSRSFSNRDTEQNFSPLQSAGSTSPNYNEKNETKASRTSCMLSRMTSSISTRRRNLSQTIPTTPHQVESHPAEPPTIIGDVNVQFPGTLLWKRKTLMLDSEGNLIMAPLMSTHNGSTTSNLQNACVSRKFSIREFKMPHVPHVEVEELPNSVILDFLEQGSLQIACEHRMGQERVLNTLQDAYRKWTATADAQ